MSVWSHSRRRVWSSAVEDEVDDYYFEYSLTRARGAHERLASVDELYEGYLLCDGVSETRIGSIDTDGDAAAPSAAFDALEESFFSAGERLAAEARAEAREIAELLAELAS